MDRHTRMNKKRRVCRQFWAGFLSVAMLVLLLLPTTIHAKSSSSSPTRISSKQSQTTPHQSLQQQHVLIYETEVLDVDENIWKGALPSRWTFTDESPSPPPIHVDSPQNYKWNGDWKIVLSDQTTDKLGWQYIGKTRKRRTWLRSIVPTNVEDETSSAVSTTTTTTTTQKRRRLYNPFSTAVDFFQQDWNWKGFGWSFYKSLIFLESVGMSFRIPLSQNLDWCERHQLFPSISSSIGLYYPPTIAVFLSISANVHYMKWVLQRMQQYLHITCRRLIVALCKSLLVILSLPLFLINQDSKWQQSWLSSITSFQSDSTTTALVPAPVQVDISERVGMSVSWRISRKRGYEFRVSYWHSYLPTILYIHSLLQFLSTQKQPKLPMEYWLRRKTASLGLSTSGPTPDPPHFSCSACVSLSGFQYSNLLSKMNFQEKEIVLKSTQDSTTTDEIKNQVNRKIKRVKKATDTNEVEEGSSGAIKQVAR